VSRQLALRFGFVEPEPALAYRRIPQASHELIGSFNSRTWMRRARRETDGRNTMQTLRMIEALNELFELFQAIVPLRQVIAFDVAESALYQCKASDVWSVSRRRVTA
jgi:hypothetical protein